MEKLSLEDKINIYKKRKSGVSLSELSRMYEINVDSIKYLCRLVDRHGYEVLCKNKYLVYPASIRQEMIDEVLINKHSIKSTAIEYGLLDKKILRSWLKIYKKEGCAIIKESKEAPSIMNKKNKTKSLEVIELEKKVESLTKKNLELQAERDYLKKLRAVVLSRENQQPKKK